MIFDLIIIGGGASGLAAAITAASMGVRHIAVIERNARVGRKILSTGNGRCNLSHTGITPEDYCGSYRPDAVLSAFGEAENFFDMIGLCLRTDPQGRKYPYSMSATTVLDVLRESTARYGVLEFCNMSVKSMYFQDELWHLKANRELFQAPLVIFAAGGCAAPQFGTDGTAWALLEAMDIPIVPPRPMLCPLLTDSSQRELRGLRVKCTASLIREGETMHTEEGEVQFKEEGLSGICIFDLSLWVQPGRSYEVALDLIPEEDTGETLSRLYALQAAHSGSPAAGMLRGIFHKPLARHLCRVCDVMHGMPCEELTGEQMERLAKRIHDLRFPVRCTADYAKAQATRGGVRGDALDENLQVRRKPGLYIVGEAVDVQAPCGGYQLHWAWSSGYTAGIHAARCLQEHGGVPI
ncbi:MAG: aminoacetone oxidase family FAD-binding enzyme [Oscillospiraceae bacterium]|nr:aminoacetone oxidase family FAD-binding enzyme [Oscillospiraceae bacterium]